MKEETLVRYGAFAYAVMSGGELDAHHARFETDIDALLQARSNPGRRGK